MSGSGSAVIVVPCYNEAGRLNSAAFRDFVERESDIRFCFVNDGSTDETAAVLRALCTTSPRLHLLDLERNQGKAEAVRRGVLYAMTLDPEFVGYWDADLATPLDAIRPLLDVVRHHPTLVLAMGSRVQILGRDIQRNEMRHYVGRIMATLAAFALRVRVYDTQCGAKVMRADDRLAAVLREPFRHRWLFDVELIARVFAGSPDVPRHRLVNEVPLGVWRDVAGSRVRLRDGFGALRELYRIWRAYPYESRARATEHSARAAGL